MAEGRPVVALGSDHAGFELKERIKVALDELNVSWRDFGTNSLDSCDYPDYARAVAEAVAAGEVERGIVCCGSGVGVSIVANKVRGIRAALCHTVEGAELSRQHNNANVLAMSGRTQDIALVKPMVKVFLETEFEGGRHSRRVDKIEKPRQGESESAWKAKSASKAVNKA